MRWLVVTVVLACVMGCKSGEWKRKFPVDTEGPVECDSVTVIGWLDGTWIGFWGRLENVSERHYEWVLVRFEAYNQEDSLLGYTMALSDDLRSSPEFDSFSFGGHIKGISKPMDYKFKLVFAEGYR